MPDVLANGTFGRDDGIKCHECGGPTFLTDDQGQGLCSYDCNNETCGAVTQVQFDFDDDDGDPADDYFFDPLDEELYGGTTFGSQE